MRPLKITIDEEIHQKIKSGKQKRLCSLRNPKRDRWLKRWNFQQAMINGSLYPIIKTICTETEWQLTFGKEII